MKDIAPAELEFGFLVGRAVEQIWIWGPIRLILELGDRPEPAMYVDVHASTYVRTAGVEASLNVLDRPSEAGAVLVLLNTEVVSARAERGVLHVSFVNGTELHSPPDERRETWTVVGDGRVFQCMPGGEVDSW